MTRAGLGASSAPLDAGSTRETILRTAARVFLTHGYEESSMDQIALESGVARRTLYNQFGAKKVLFDATMAQMWDQMPLDAIIDATAAVKPPEEVLYSIGRTIGELLGAAGGDGVHAVGDLGEFTISGARRELFRQWQGAGSAWNPTCR
jgi:AcrR family transcriptional regulator